MKRKIICLLTVFFSAVFLFVLTACNRGGGNHNGLSAYEIWLENGFSGTYDDFLEWLKGTDGKDGEPGLSAYEIYVKYNPDYPGTEEQWINALVNHQLYRCTVTFQAEGHDDIVRKVFYGFTLTDIPEVPAKVGYVKAVWDRKEFTNITQDLTVKAVYSNDLIVTFHNEFTDDADVVKVVSYGEAITDIPTVTPKAYNDGYWSVADLSQITSDLEVYAVYATQGLSYTLNADQSQYSVAKGDMNSQTEEVYILAEYDGKPVTSVAQNAFEDEDAIRSVYIPNGVKTLGAWAFKGCNSLTEIVLPDSITQIGAAAFINCSNLPKVEIPSGVTAIASDVFAECSGLTRIEIPSGVTAIGSSAFKGCTGLEEIVIPSGVATIGDFTFDGCSSLTEIVLPDSLTKIGAAAFTNCSNLSKIEIPNAVKEIREWTFYACRSLTEVILPDSLMSIGTASFNKCSSLTQIEIASSVYFIGTGAFYGCTSLTSVVFKNTSGWGVSSNRAIEADDLKDPATAAVYLTETYITTDWTRS